MKDFTKVKTLKVRISLWNKEMFVWTNHEAMSIGSFRGNEPTKREEKKALDNLRAVSGKTYVGCDIVVEYYMRQRCPRVYERESLAKKPRPLIVKEESKIR